VVEREAEVLAVEGGEARLRLIGSCRGCGGCGGRCGLLDAIKGDSASLALDCFDTPPLPGQRLRLALPGSSLLRAAGLGYGLPLLGLLLGALAGRLLAGLMAWPADALTLLGAVLGTSLAFRGSKRVEAGPQSRLLVVTLVDGQPERPEENLSNPTQENRCP